eukprot:13725392-Ditylum_brightwellii.AAC.1
MEAYHNAPSRWHVTSVLLSFSAGQHLSTFPQPHQKIKVQGHANRTKSWDSMTRLEQLNCVCDKTSQAYLQQIAQNHNMSENRVPFEGWLCWLRQTKVQGHLCPHLLCHIYMPAARQCFLREKLLSARSFVLVNWDTIDRAMNSVSSTVNIWSTKHITGFCATAHRLHLIGCRSSNLCPSCNE